MRLPRQPFGLPRNDSFAAAVLTVSLRGESEANDVEIRSPNQKSPAPPDSSTIHYSLYSLLPIH